MLTLNDVRASIGGVPVLRNASCVVANGKTTVLVGRNGAGKTTTLRAIMGLLRIDHGEIRLDDRDIVADPAYLRAKLGIGYAPEDRRLVPEFSIEENITLPALALALPGAEVSRRLSEIYSLLPQLEKLRLRPGGSVSGGQGKMVALGRALMVARTALLLDEPFQGLAPALALEYAQTLGELRKRRPELSLLITESSPALLNDVADVTFQIERGDISPA